MLILFLLVGFLSDVEAQQLIQSNVVCRHADRAPMRLFTSHEAEAYFFRGLGELSNQGLQRANNLGLRIRERTVDVGLIDKRMIPSQVYFRSTIVPRCLMSASAMGAAIFDPVASTLPSYVPVATQPKETDFVCNAQTSEQMAAIMGQMAGMNITPTSGVQVQQYYVNVQASQSTYFNGPNMTDMIETLPIEKDAGLPVPTWFNASAEDEANSIVFQNNALTTGIGEFHNDFLIKCRIGVLLDKICTDLQQAADCVASNCSVSFYKLNAYTSHDSMMMPLIEALGIYERVLGNTSIPFASAILTELWMVNGTPNLKFLFFTGRQEDNFVDYTNIVSGCEGTTYCPIASFLNATAKYRIKESELEQCGYFTDVKTSARITIMLSLCFMAWSFS